MGILDVSDVLASLTAKEFRGWEMYDEIEPFTEKRQDWRIASIVQMIYNTMGRGAKDKAKPLRDFLLKYDADDAEATKPARTQSLAQQANMLRLIAAMHAGDPDPKPDTTPGQVGPLPPEIKAKVDEAMKRTA